MIGKTISHYRIMEELGRGGMGVLYKAEDTKLKRTVALKFLPPDLTRDSDAKERFVQEAQTASALDHNNICTIHEIDETTDGQMYIVMTYYEGETLREKIKGGSLELDNALNIGIQIAEGLSKAHAKGIVHRDIKPANIMITTDGVVKILDFGLAKLAGQSRITKTKTTMGTVVYMSPEQVTGKEVDHRTDVWSLGVVLYEMLTGQLPFKGEIDQAVIYSILNEDPEPVSTLRSDVPKILDQFIAKALAKNLDGRYQRVDEFHADLTKIDTGSETSIIPKLPKVARSFGTKNILKKVVLPVGILLLTVFAFLWLRPIFDKGETEPEPLTIAVISFENQTGDSTYDHFEKVIPNLLITSLEQSPNFQVMTWSRMHDLLKKLGKEDVDVINEELGFELCLMDGVKKVILGSFTKADELFATDVKVLDVKTKNLLKSASSNGEGISSIIRNQIDDLSWELSRYFGVPEQEIEKTQMPVANMTSSMEAYNYFIRGREDFEKGYAKEARKFLEKAVQLDSTFASAYLYLSFANADLNNMKAMYKYLKIAKNFSDKATEKEKLLIELHYTWNIEKPGTGKAFTLLKEMVKKFPKEKRFHKWLGLENKERKLYHDAIMSFEMALKLDPKYGAALEGLASTYAEIEKFEQAIKYYNQYAFVSPGDAQPLVTIANIYFRMGKLDNALDKYREALEIKPDFGVDYMIGYIYALEENYDKAIELCDQMIANAPSSGIQADGYAWRAFFNFWKGNYEQYPKDMHQAVNLWRNSGYGFLAEGVEFFKAWFYYDNNKLELGKKHFINWTKFSKRANLFQGIALYEDARLNQYLGLVHVKQGQIDSAIVRLNKTKSILPQIDRARYIQQLLFHHDLLYSEILLAQDSLKKAVTVAENATLGKIPRRTTLGWMLSYNVPFDRDVLPRIYLKKGDVNKAIKAYEGLITFDPNKNDRRLIYPKYHYRLAKLYEEKGRSKKAIEQYEKFLEIWRNADKDLPELIDAKARLERIEGDS